MESKKTMVDIDSALNLKKKDLHAESPFVTIFLPLEYDSEESPYQVLDELIKEVKTKLEDLSVGNSLNAIYKKLNRLIVKLPPQNFYKSVVAFLSEDVEDIIPLNYTVEKKAVVSDNFDFEEVQKFSVSKADQEEKEKEEELRLKSRSLRMETRLFGKRTY